MQTKLVVLPSLAILALGFILSLTACSPAAAPVFPAIEAPKSNLEGHVNDPMWGAKLQEAGKFRSGDVVYLWGDGQIGNESFAWIAVKNPGNYLVFTTMEASSAEYLTDNGMRYMHQAFALYNEGAKTAFEVNYNDLGWLDYLDNLPFVRWTVCGSQPS